MEQTDKEKNNGSILSRVQGAIQSGRVRIKPRWHFVLHAALGAVGVAILLLAILYLASFIIFVLRATGVWFVPMFGWHGWYEFFRSAPWILIVLCIVFIVVLETVVRTYAFAYRAPLLYSAIAVILIVIAGGVLIAATPLHRGLFHHAEHNRLPFAGGMYRGFGLQRMSNVHVGTITQIIPSGFVIENRRGETLRVALDPSEIRRSLAETFVLGNTIVVFGPRSGAVVRALGVRKIDSELGPDEFLRPTLPRQR